VVTVWASPPLSCPFWGKHSDTAVDTLVPIV